MSNDDLSKHELVAIDRAITLARRPLKRSAPVLIRGLLITAVGMIMSEVGRQQQIDAALRGSYSNGSTADIGGLVTIVGILFTLIGAFRLATAVDRAAVIGDAVLALTVRLEDLAPQPEAVYDEGGNPIDP